MTPHKQLTRYLPNHTLKWPVSSRFFDYIDMRQVPKQHRDDSYREKVAKQYTWSKVKECHLKAPRPQYAPRGEVRPDVFKPFRPDMWYAWKCDQLDKKEFNFKIRCRPENPRRQDWISCLSHPVKPQINVTGWRKRLEASFDFAFFILDG